MNDASAVVENLSARGITVRVVAGRLEIRPASALTERDRAAIRLHAAALVAELTPDRPARSDGESWDLAEAIRRMYDADTLVGQLGVDGRHPAVQDAAGRVSDAFTAGDAGAFRSALSAFVMTVRRAAAEGTFGSQNLPTAPARSPGTAAMRPNPRPQSATG